MSRGSARDARSAPGAQTREQNSHHTSGPSPFPPQVGHRVHMDLCGPFKSAHSRGNVYILVLIDALSKFIRLSIILDKRAETIIRAITNDWIRNFSSMRYLFSDNGGEFRNAKVAKFCQGLGIIQQFTAARHPQANGQCERVMSDIKAKLTKLIAERCRRGDNWTDLLPEVEISHNTAVHSSTKVEPQTCMLGRKITLSQFILPDFLRDLDIELDDHNEFDFLQRYTQTRDRAKYLRKVARQNMEVAQKRQEASFNRKHRAQVPPTYEPGQRVLVRFPERTCPNPKFDPPWKEATIKERISDTTYMAKRDGTRGKATKFNVHDIKPLPDGYNSTETESDADSETEENLEEEEDQDVARELPPHPPLVLESESEQEDEPPDLTDDEEEHWRDIADTASLPDSVVVGDDPDFEAGDYQEEEEGPDPYIPLEPEEIPEPNLITQGKRKRQHDDEPRIRTKYQAVDNKKRKRPEGDGMQTRSKVPRINALLAALPVPKVDPRYYRLSYWEIQAALANPRKWWRFLPYLGLALAGGRGPQEPPRVATDTASESGTESIREEHHVRRDHTSIRPQQQEMDPAQEESDLVPEFRPRDRDHEQGRPLRRSRSVRNLFRKAFKLPMGREVARGGLRESSPGRTPELHTAAISLSASADLETDQKEHRKAQESTHITTIDNVQQDHDGGSYHPLHHGPGYHVPSHQGLHVPPREGRVRGPPRGRPIYMAATQERHTTGESQGRPSGQGGGVEGGRGRRQREAGPSTLREGPGEPGEGDQEDPEIQGAGGGAGLAPGHSGHRSLISGGRGSRETRQEQGEGVRALLVPLGRVGRRKDHTKI